MYVIYAIVLSLSLTRARDNKKTSYYVYYCCLQKVHESVIFLWRFFAPEINSGEHHIRFTSRDY